MKGPASCNFSPGALEDVVTFDGLAHARESMPFDTSHFDSRMTNCNATTAVSGSVDASAFDDFEVGELLDAGDESLLQLTRLCRTKRELGSFSTGPSSIETRKSLLEIAWVLTARSELEPAGGGPLLLASLHDHVELGSELASVVLETVDGCCASALLGMGTQTCEQGHRGQCASRSYVVHGCNPLKIN